MGIEDKKNDVLDMLKNTNDSELINEVYELLHPAEAVEDVSLDQLPAPLQQKINKALDDYKSGNYITHEQMKQKLQESF